MLRRIRRIGARVASVTKTTWQRISPPFSWVARLTRRASRPLWKLTRLAARAFWKAAVALKQGIPAFVAALIGIGLVVWGIVRLHAALRPSQDAWAASIEAVTTAALVLITAWYAYLTSKLLGAQRTGARVAGWEAALRDLSFYLSSKRRVMWTAAGFFPVDQTVRPPMILDVLRSREALTEIRDHLLDVMGLLPEKFSAQALGVAAYLVDAEQELFALGVALLDETQAGLAAKRSWTWPGARSAHEASTDPERSELWDEIMQGRLMQAAQERWEQLSDDIDRHLRRLSREFVLRSQPLKERPARVRDVVCLLRHHSAPRSQPVFRADKPVGFER